ncbi:hypothetical protein MTR_6g055620 [Medicago truncatula]|uniref:Uncharacterized protein n=1 Tax=Medicago truncatula TaxID=3880 RepID=G7KM09_MEDTR|nr:hypothetical protein MTR_6g055620 [Medicago truncatula]
MSCSGLDAADKNRERERERAREREGKDTKQYRFLPQTGSQSCPPCTSKESSLCNI